MPGEFESILTKLQGKLGKQTVRRASTINRPRPKREVQQIQIFNEFNRRNPRADGGLLNGSSEEAAASAFRKKVEELMDDGYDFGEAVREAMRQGYQDGGKAKYKYQTRKAPPGFFYDRRGNTLNDTKYIERNAGNKNIWIGKHINISNSDCFDNQKIHINSAEPTALTNLIIYNKL